MLHYSNPDVQALEQVRRHGEYVPVRLRNRAWLVHHIALHGIKAIELLGLQEIP